MGVILRFLIYISKFSTDTRGLVLFSGSSKKEHKLSKPFSIGMIVIAGLVRLLGRGDLMMMIIVIGVPGLAIIIALAMFLIQKAKR